MIREQICDIWDRHEAGAWVAITTNPIVNRDGKLVMGRGTARQASEKFLELPYKLGALDRMQRLSPYILTQYRLVTLPVKYHWRDKADISLIVNSLTTLAQLCANTDIATIYVPRPGCGNGQLEWSDVRTAILRGFEQAFDSFEDDLKRFIFVDKEAE